MCRHDLSTRQRTPLLLTQAMEEMTCAGFCLRSWRSWHSAAEMFPQVLLSSPKSDAKECVFGWKKIKICCKLLTNPPTVYVNIPFPSTFKNLPLSSLNGKAAEEHRHNSSSDWINLAEIQGTSTLRVLYFVTWSVNCASWSFKCRWAAAPKKFCSKPACLARGLRRENVFKANASHTRRHFNSIPKILLGGQVHILVVRENSGGSLSWWRPL